MAKVQCRLLNGTVGLDLVPAVTLTVGSPLSVASPLLSVIWAARPTAPLLSDRRLIAVSATLPDEALDAGLMADTWLSPEDMAAAVMAGSFMPTRTVTLLGLELQILDLHGQFGLAALPAAPQQQQAGVLDAASVCCLVPCSRLSGTVHATIIHFLFAHRCW